MKVNGAVYCTKNELDAALNFLLHKIKQLYPREYETLQIIKRQEGYHLSLSCGDTWVCEVADRCQTCGVRRSIVYYSEKISPDIIRECIKPAANIGLQLCEPVNFRYEKYIELLNNNDFYIQDNLFEE